MSRATGIHRPRPTGSDDELAVVCGVIAGAHSVLLAAHINPDADALGSALALGLGLRQRGVEVTVAFAEPDRVPESLAGLPGQELIRLTAEIPSDIDLLVTLDVGSAERLGSLADWLDAVPSVVIDHHPSNTRFGTHHLVDPTAEATVVLVHRILRQLDVAVSADIAADLYAGLATDTGMFRHIGPGTHRLAAEFVEAGVRPGELLPPIMDSHPFGWLHMLSAVLGRAELVPTAAAGRGLVHTRVTLADAEGLRQEELDSVIDIVRTAREAAVAVVAKETAADRWQVSLRSGPGFDVAAAAQAFGGGGHRHAAGFSWSGTYPAAIAALVDQLR